MSMASIGIGSNLGDAQANCIKAVEKLGRLRATQVVKTSSLYKTEPVGYENQPWFVNCVVLLETRLPPAELLIHLQAIERSMGRKKGKKWGPRPIDLDILFYDDLIITDDDLIVPHPELQNRKFVLQPLVEIDPNKVHPVLKNTVRSLFRGLDDDKEVVTL